MSSDTTAPTREQVQQALHAIDDKDSDFVVYPIRWPRWPWNHLIAAARLWLESPKVDEAMIERVARILNADCFEDVTPEEAEPDEDDYALAQRVLRAALEVTAMSDTIALKEACGHNLYDAHCSAGYEWHVEPHNCEGRVDSRGDLVCERCPGGRERTFEFLEECCTRCGNDCADHSVGVWKEIADERRVAQPPVNIGNL